MSGPIRISARFLASSVVVAAICCCLSAGAVAGESHDQSGSTPAVGPRITALRAGFAGRFKVGCWAPFDVTLEPGEHAFAGTVDLTLPDGDGVPSRVRSASKIAIAADGQATVRLYAKVGQMRGEVTVEMHGEARGDNPLVVARRFPLGEEGPLAGMLSSERALVLMVGMKPTPTDQAHFAQRGAIVATCELDALADEWWGYEGVDLVVIATGEKSLAEKLAQPSPQLKSLDTWVRMGGTLLLSVGREARTVLAAESPLARWAPGPLKGLVPLRQSTVIEAYAETSEPLSTVGDRFSLEVPQLQDAEGAIEVYAGKEPRDLPLVVRRPYGFGQVVWLALDLESPLMTQWRGRSPLLDKLWKRTRVASTDGDSTTQGEVTTLGFEDLGGQLRGALDQFTQSPLVPFWLVAALLVAYVACIGPLDYYLVTRVLHRPEATWITFAVTVVAFSVGTYLLAYGIKGRQLLLNQVDVVDFDMASGTMRSTSWLNLFSPETATYDLALRPAASVASSPGATGSAGAADSTGPGNEPRELFSWWGLPGPGFGGMSATQASMPLFTEPYDFLPRLDGLSGVPIAVWSSKALVGRGWAEAPSPIEARLTHSVRLRGTLENRGDATLLDCVLLYERWAYPIRQLRPGQVVDLETIDPQTVDTYLKHVTVQGDRNVSLAYDRTSFDVPRIVEIMSTYGLAGGEKYTSLANQDQSFVDLSGLVRVGRAVLIGHRDARAVELVQGGEPLECDGQHWTVSRFVFPVDPEPAR